MRRVLHFATAALLWVAMAPTGADAKVLTYTKRELNCLFTLAMGEGGSSIISDFQQRVNLFTVKNRILAATDRYSKEDFGGPDACEVVRWRLGRGAYQYSFWYQQAGMMEFKPSAELDAWIVEKYRNPQKYEANSIEGEDLPDGLIRPLPLYELEKRAWEAVLDVFVKDWKPPGDLIFADTYQDWCYEPSYRTQSCINKGRVPSARSQCYFALSLVLLKDQPDAKYRRHLYYRTYRDIEVWAILHDGALFFPKECEGPDDPERNWYPREFVPKYRAYQRARIMDPRPDLKRDEEAKEPPKIEPKKKKSKKEKKRARSSEKKKEKSGSKQKHKKSCTRKGRRCS